MVFVQKSSKIIDFAPKLRFIAEGFKCQKVLALSKVPALNELDLGAQKELKGVLGL